MKPSPYSAIIILFFLLCDTGFAQLKKPRTGALPIWASVAKYSYNNNSLEREAEGGYFDLAFEKQVSLEQQSVYVRKAIKVLTESGVQNSSEISVTFDPSYQNLTFHTVKILRNNSVIDQLDLSKFKTIQQESDLARHIYDGSLSSVLFLEDVRKGDIIEYSYTIKGFNPIFQGKYSTIFDVDFEVPVGSLYYKLIVPNEREVSIKARNTDIKPVIHDGTHEKIYEWNLQWVKPRRVQDNLPSWYDPYSTIMVSEYRSWKEVNDWALNLFPLTTQISAELQSKISEIAAQNTTAEQRVLAALRFVQDDIRYLGIEMGESSHKPGNPNKIFSQRFGDCKDKSYLLCTMLRSMDIQAFPVLINTSSKKTINEWLPTTTAFDHATVQVQLNNTKYWFDPTISYQRGRINVISYPDYQYGLVVSPSTQSLEKINAKEPGNVRVKEVFSIPDMNGKATLKVTSYYSGSYADDIRSSFNNNSSYEMQKTFRDYYSSYYKQITADSIDYQDDEKTGLFVTTELYSIEGIWELEDGKKKASFAPFVINGLIKRPKDLNREMPFSLMWPAKYREEIEIHLPEDWTAEQNSETIKSNSLSMSAKLLHDGKKTIFLEYTYENLKDYVNADDIEEYTESLEKRDKEFNYVLTYSVADKVNTLQPKKTTRNTTNGLYASLLVLFLIGGIIWWVMKR